MKYKIAAILILVSLTLFHYTTFLVSSVFAEEAVDSPQANKELLQKGLTIYEIDKEIARLNEQDVAIADQIKQNELAIEQQKKDIEKTKKHAAQVLRAYYTGERQSIWMILLSANSFSDALKLLEYMQMIMSNDLRALSAFTASYENLKNLQTALDDSHAELQKTRDAYLQQRERLLTLQQQLDNQLSGNAQAKAIEEQIQTLNAKWKEQGMPLFKEYLNQLSAAFQAFPQYVIAGNIASLDLSNIKNPVLTITDRDFNTYIHSKSETLQNLDFEFADDTIIARGKKGEVNVVLQGTFVLKEGTGMNEVKFIVNQLTFNGFQLPDTTIEDFMKQFQLGFIPKKMVSYLDVVGVVTKKGSVLVKFKFM